MKAEASAQREALAKLRKQLANAAEQQRQNGQQLAQAGALSGAIGQMGTPMAGQLAAQGATVPGAFSPGGVAAAGASAGTGTSASAGAGASAGSGAGTGTGAGAGASAGAGAGGLQGGTGIGSRNLVTTPRTMEGSGNIQTDTGPSATGSGEIEKGGQSPMMDGTTRPYEEVYSQYANEAKSAVDRHELPQNMQNLVRDYFIEIQP